MTWVDFKRSFTKEQEDAIWQYFIDHSQVQKNGYLGILFYVYDIDDFFQRVHARFTGQFHRYEKQEKQERQKKASMTFKNYEVRARINNKIAERIDKSGTLYEKILIFVHRWTRKRIYGK